MGLTIKNIAGMMDLSCVQTYNTEKDIASLVSAAKKYKCKCVSTLPCYISKVVQLLGDDAEILVVGNIGFPSGGDTTNSKVAQAKELINLGCDEFDMVMNVGWLKSRKYAAVKQDIISVVDVAMGKPVKVILEVSCLTDYEIQKACEICIKAGATFVKTGTGWNGKTTMEQIRLIKSVVGDRIKIKAAGGIRDLNTLLNMYRQGVTRFGVNLNSGISILKECSVRSSYNLSRKL